MERIRRQGENAYVTQSKYHSTFHDVDVNERRLSLSHKCADFESSSAGYLHPANTDCAYQGGNTTNDTGIYHCRDETESVRASSILGR